MSTTATAPERAEAPVVAFKAAKAGPIRVRVPADWKPEQYPTVEEFARTAFSSFMHIHSNVDEERWAQLLEAKRQRDAAKSAVKVAHLRKTGKDGAVFTQTELAPLVTQVRRELNRLCRQRVKDARAQARARKRNEERDERRRAAGRVKAKAHLLKKAKAAILPDGHPQLGRGLAPKTTAGAKPQFDFGWVVKLSTGWQLVVGRPETCTIIPLNVADETVVRDNYPIPREALKAIEKGGGFRITKDGAVQPLNVRWSGMSVHIAGVGAEHITYPQVNATGVAYTPPSYITEYGNGNPFTAKVLEGGKATHTANARACARVAGRKLPSRTKPLLPPAPKVRDRIEVSVDVDLLRDACHALGQTSNPGKSRVTIVLDAKQLVTVDGVGREHPGSPIRVERIDGKGTAIVCPTSAKHYRALS